YAQLVTREAGARVSTLDSLGELERANAQRGSHTQADRTQSRVRSWPRPVDRVRKSAASPLFALTFSGVSWQSRMALRSTPRRWQAGRYGGAARLSTRPRRRRRRDPSCPSLLESIRKPAKE